MVFHLFRVWINFSASLEIVNISKIYLFIHTYTLFFREIFLTKNCINKNSFLFLYEWILFLEIYNFINKREYIYIYNKIISILTVYLLFVRCCFFYYFIVIDRRIHYFDICLLVSKSLCCAFNYTCCECNNRNWISVLWSGHLPADWWRNLCRKTQKIIVSFS